MHIDRERILRMLPHRDPILLVESASVEMAARSGRAQARLNGDTTLFDGLTGCELVNELVLEAAAQSVGLVLGGVAATSGGADERHLLLGFDGVQFEELVASPDQVLDIDIQIKETGAVASSASFRVTQHGRCVAHGSVLVMRGTA